MIILWWGDGNSDDLPAGVRSKRGSAGWSGAIMKKRRSGEEEKRGGRRERRRGGVVKKWGED